MFYGDLECLKMKLIRKQTVKLKLKHKLMFELDNFSKSMIQRKDTMSTEKMQQKQCLNIQNFN